MLRGLVEPVLGGLLILLVLLDVLLTVLYARMGTGIISIRLARLIWRLFYGLSKGVGRYRGAVLSFCGPAILVLLILVWAAALTCGTALILHPSLGTGVRVSNGETPTDFITALYAGGSSMAIVGSSDFMPQTAAFRMLYLFNSLVGLSILSLTLTYFSQVYTALQRRNVLGLKIHLMSAETADAAELIAGLGPEGQFASGYTNLADLAQDMAFVKESHHFYPVLFYFRFPRPVYAVSRFTLVALDTVTLIASALDDQRYAWFKETASVTQLGRASMLLLTTLEDTFVPGGAPGPQQAPLEEETQDRWRRRYFAALRRLRQAGIETVADEQAGAAAYVSLRARWDPHIATLAPMMAYSRDEIDPVGSAPETSDARPAFRGRLRPVT